MTPEQIFATIRYQGLKKWQAGIEQARLGLEPLRRWWHQGGRLRCSYCTALCYYTHIPCEYCPLKDSDAECMDEADYLRGLFGHGLNALRVPLNRVWDDPELLPLENMCEGILVKIEASTYHPEMDNALIAYYEKNKEMVEKIMREMNDGQVQRQ